MNSDTPEPSGGDTLIEVLHEAAAQGYAVQQIAVAGGQIKCTSCGRHSAAADVHVDHVRRLEGASDAADLLLVAWAPCPACGERGVVTLGYGPNASDTDTAVMADLDLSNADASPTTGATPDAEHERIDAQLRDAEARRPTKVLIGVDESHESRDAIETAFALLGPDAEYTIAVMHDSPPLVLGGMGAGTTIHGLHAHVDEVMERRIADRAVAIARDALPPDADVAFHTDVGPAARGLCDAASEHGSDLIVIGSQDRGFWDRLFTPSVGKYLVDHAPCPVLIVR